MKETELIKNIKKIVGRPGKGVKAGIGDDCAVIEYDKKHYMLFASDMLIEGTHFKVNRSGYEKIGRKAALRHFRSSVKTDRDYSDIKTAMTNYLATDTVKKGFIKNGSTWFNDWRDYINYKDPKKSSADGASRGSWGRKL